MTFQPVIKWSGSKRSQSDEIIKYFPQNINTYYEPFCGGCSVLRRLLESNIVVNNYICSDLNSDLIELWKLIKKCPNDVYEWYDILWNELNKDNNLERKKEYYKTIRERFNNYHNPLDFMFIMRTTTNGMPRYNKDGLFNNSFHITRNGINPLHLKEILLEWSDLLNRFNVTFECSTYNCIVGNYGDFMYLDPPYANTKGMYFSNFDIDLFFDWIRNQKCSYAFSFDGISDKDNTFDISKEIYDIHVYIMSGNSSFRRVIGKSNNCYVRESLYIKYNNNTK